MKKSIILALVVIPSANIKILQEANYSWKDSACEYYPGII